MSGGSALPSEKLKSRWSLALWADPTMLFVVASRIAWVTDAGDAVGFASRYNAATPAVWGEAMDVPLAV